jgi:cyclohexa-1,5-dienecarbonyl-CoA hydratase
MPYEFLEVETCDGVANVRMRRLPVNVLHAPMMSELATALDHAEGSSDIRTVVITGDGTRVFSGGVEIGDHTRERVSESIDQFYRLLRKVQEFPLPTIAALNGSALGGGFELALACNMMLSVPDAKLGHPEIKLASIAFPGLLMLQGRLPSNLITELLAGGEYIDGTRAHHVGLVNQLVSKEGFASDVALYASRFARMSEPVLRLMMRTLKLARGKTLHSGFEACSRLYLDELMPLEDVVEGLDAFVAKRPPVWKNR